MLKKRDWEEFRDAGLLWFVNRILHLFGWAIVFLRDHDDKLVEVFPARCEFRGFSEAVEEQGFRELTEHLSGEMPRLMSTVTGLKKEREDHEEEGPSSHRG